MADVGALRVTLGLDSIDFTQGMKSINSKLTALSSEFKAITAGAGRFDNSLESLRAKSDVLTRTLTAHRTKVSELNDRYKESVQVNGATAAATEKLLTQYNNAIAAMKRTESQLQQTNSKIQEQGNEFNQLGVEVNQSVDRITREMRLLDTAFESATAGIREFGSSTDQLQQKSDHLNSSIQLQQQRVEELTRIHRASVTANGEHAQATQELAIRLNRATSELRETEQQLRETTQQIDDQANRWRNLGNAAAASGDRMQRVGGKMQGMGSEITQSFGVAFAAVGGALALSAKKAMDFEQQMSSVKSVMSPAEVNEFGGALSDLAMKMGSETKYSAIEAAMGIEELIKAGVKTTDIVNGGLEGALALATAGELELADAAEIASTALNAFANDNLTVMRAADILAGGANASATSVSELKFSLAAVSAVASGVGFSFEDTTTALSVFAQNGLKGSDAGTSLKTMLLRLSPTTKAAREAFDNLGLSAYNVAAGYKFLVDKGITPTDRSVKGIEEGLKKLSKQESHSTATKAELNKAYTSNLKASGLMSSAFYDEEGNVKSMAEVAGLLQNAMKGLNDEQRQNYLNTMFGSDAIRAGNILYKEGAEGIQNMNKELNKISAADVAAEKLNNVHGRITALKSAVETAAIAIGNSLLPTIDKVVAIIKKMVDGFNGLSPKMQTFITTGALVAAAVLGIVTAIGVMLMIVGQAIAGVGAIVSLFGSASLAIAGAGGAAGIFATAIAFITGPIGIAIAAIVGLVAAGIAVYKNWDSIKEFLSNTWTLIATTATSVWSGITTFFSNTWTSIATTTASVWNSIKEFFSTWGLTILAVITGPIGMLSLLIYNNWESIKAKTIEVWGSITEWFSTTWTSIQGTFVSAGEGIKTASTAVWEAVKTGILAAITPIVTGVTTLFGNMKNGLTTVMDGLGQYFTGAWTVIKNIFLGAILLIVDLVTGDFGRLKTDAIAIMMNLSKGISDMWEGLKKIFSGALEVIKAYVTTVWNGIKTLTGTVFDFIKTTIQQTWENVKTFTTTALEAVKNVARDKFEALKDAVSDKMDALKNRISDIWATIRTLSERAPELIRTAVTNKFESMKNAVADKMNAMKARIIDIWNAIKTGSERAPEAIRTTATNKFEQMKSAVAEKMSAMKNKIIEMWNGAVSFLTSIDLRQIGVNIIQGLVGGIGSMLQSVKDKVKSIADAVTGTIRKVLDINSPSRVTDKLGKETGQGFADGISSKEKAVAAATKKTANAAKKAFNEAMDKAEYQFKMGKINATEYIKELKKIRDEDAKTAAQRRTVNLEINKVEEKHAKDLAAARKKQFNEDFTAIKDKAKLGKITAEEELKQLKDLAGDYKKNSAERIAVEKEVKKVKDQIAKDAKKQFNEDLKAIKDKAELGKITAVEEIKLLEELGKKHKKNSAERITVEKEIKKVKEDIAKEEAAAVKKQFDDEKKLIDNKKYYNELSLADELKDYEENIKKYKKGSEERIFYEREIYRVKQEINKELTAANDEYSKKILDANQKLIDGEKALTDEYNKSVEARTKSLYSFAGLFDQIAEKTDVSGQQLIDNLQGQVDTFAEWADNISALAAKGIDEGLLAELREAGPKSAAEIAALNSLSGEELDKYVALWKEKNALAKEQALTELEGMKGDTQVKIEELRTQTAKDLEIYKTEWIKKIQEIRTGTTDEYLKMNATMKDIGKDSIKGLMAGMTAMTGPLLAQAKAIADSISATIKSALQIQSPSQLMKNDVGKFIPLGIAEGIKANLSSVIDATNLMAMAAIPQMSVGQVNTPIFDSGSTQSVSSNPSNSYGDIYITIPAKDVKEFVDVTDFFNRLPQAQKAR